jgi:arginyl-tRNA synthetase
MSKDQIVSLIQEALGRAVDEGQLPGVEVERIELDRPKRREHGDWATNLALVIAPGVGKKPREVAEIIAGRLPDAPDIISGVEIAGPGFINFHLSDHFVRNVLFEIRDKGYLFGASSVGASRKVQVEFVSANPVGPLHVGHGRWAALGDAICSVMSHAGYDIEREYYVNDYGTQVDNFGMSISARYMELLGLPEDFPESGYRGHYIIDIAQAIVHEHGDEYACLQADERSKLFAEREYPRMVDAIRGVLERMGVTFDVWFSERDLYAKGEVGDAIEALKKDGRAYEEKGALWLRTTEFGDEKDRVLVRSNGEPTYFASDIAYHRDKMLRGFDLVIDIWGADHHGYVARMMAAMDAMGFGAEHLEVILGQLVKLFRAGEQVTMSKRTGEIVTLDELLDEVGADAARYFFLQRSADSPLEFDIELAKRESPENPVFYVQYAHARICSILRYAAEEGADMSEPSADDIDSLTAPSEMELLRKLAELEEMVEFCAERRAPHRLTGYAEELAGAFHAFYRDCRVVTEDERLTRARIFAVQGVRQVLEIVLGLLGVAAPEKM